MDVPVGHGLGGGGSHSWKSFRTVLPRTLSYLPGWSRYTTGKGVTHVLGRSGRALMKHRMGNIYVRNQFGAVCPEDKRLGADEDDGRKRIPKNMYPRCNVLSKAFVNRVGCPVDMYFAPANKVEGYDCEIYTGHLGPLEPFLAKSPLTRNIDGFNSPISFEDTYNKHGFVARMSHDQSLVARIELDHDVVRDCPEPKRAGVGVEVMAEDRIIQGVAMDTMATNATGAASSVYASSNEWLAASSKVNATTATILPVKVRDEKRELLWHNGTMGIMATSLPIIS